MHSRPLCISQPNPIYFLHHLDTIPTMSSPYTDLDCQTTEEWQTLIESLPQNFQQAGEQDVSGTTFLDVKDTEVSQEDWWNCGILDDTSVFPDNLSLDCLSPPTDSVQMEAVQNRLANLEAL